MTKNINIACYKAWLKINLKTEVIDLGNGFTEYAGVATTSKAVAGFSCCLGN